MSSLEQVQALARRAHADPDVCAGLFDALAGAERSEAYTAAWALTHLPPSDNHVIDAHRSELVLLAISTPDTSLRRLTLALLERIDWPQAEVRADLLDFALLHLADPREAVGVRALCAKLAYCQCRHYAELRAELRQTLLMLEPSSLSPGLSHTCHKILMLL